MLLGIGEHPNCPAGDGIEITPNPTASTLDEPCCPAAGRWTEPPDPSRFPDPAADVVAGCPGSFLAPRMPGDGIEIGLASESNPAILDSDSCRRLGSGGVLSRPPGPPACAVAVADAVAVPTAVRSPVPSSPRPPPRPPIPTPPPPPPPLPLLPHSSSIGNPNGTLPAAWIASRRTLPMSSPRFLPPPLLSTLPPVPLLPPLFRRRLLSL